MAVNEKQSPKIVYSHIKLDIFTDKFVNIHANLLVERTHMTTFINNINAIRKEKGITIKMIAERADQALETIQRILDGTTENPRLDTMKRIADALEVELWELFFTGERSFVTMQIELISLRTERDALVADNAILKTKVENLREKNEALKDQIIDTHNYYIKQKQNS